MSVHAKLEYIDFPTKAREMGISEANLRARILSGKELCHVFVSDAKVHRENDLPDWSTDRFPTCSWVRKTYPPTPFGALVGSDPLPPTEGVHLTGWVALTEEDARRLLTIGDRGISLEGHWVHFPDLVANEIIFVCIDFNELYETPAVSKADIFFLRREEQKAIASAPKKEANSLRIIAAMLALLRHEDGGHFPSDAKVIELLVERFGQSGGLSRRNLEAVFAQAKRVADYPGSD